MAGESEYRGRFAPSPTGPLHLGSLVAALGSYLRARAHGGRWYLRMEDIDPPREAPGAADAILHVLDALGLHWDGDVIYQSRRTDQYAEALDALVARGLAYPCTCSRSEIRAHNLEVHGGATTIYPGLCREGTRRPGRRHSWRLRAPEGRLEFEDLEVGRFGMELARQCGDFVIKRRDGFYAYQLAVVVDDADQGITEVVRGQDLLDSTPGQIFVQRSLGLPTPAYLHLPVVRNTSGQKLSKQTGAEPIRASRGGEHLVAALRFLGLPPPTALENAAPVEILEWGIRHWPERRAQQPATLTDGTGGDFSRDR